MCPPTFSSFCQATKLTRRADYLERIKIESPDEKVLVLSQFVQLLDICDDFLTNLSKSSLHSPRMRLTGSQSTVSSVSKAT